MLTTVKMKEDLIRDCKHTTYEDKRWTGRQLVLTGRNPLLRSHV